VLEEGEESADHRGDVATHAVRFLRRIPDGTCLVVLPVGQGLRGSLLGRLYLTAWDHNRATEKPLGKPCKGKGLLEEGWWDGQGRLNCTCDRGRLAMDVPCVHKVVFASLCAGSIATSVLPTAKELSREALTVEQLGADSSGAFYAVRNSPKGVSPEHRMLHRFTVGLWYCEGKRNGCPAQYDCSHIAAAKLALTHGQVQRAEGLLLDSVALSRAAHWIEGWKGRLPLLGEASGGGAAQTSREERRPPAAIAGREHGGAECRGEECWCRKHRLIFGEAQPPSDAMDEEAVELEASTSQKQVRRGGKWWAEHASEMQRATPCRAEEPPVDARGKEAVHGWGSACHSCNLTEAQRQGCFHGEAERVQAPIMLLGTEAVQITQPKLGKLSDALDHHDPMISCLRAGPVRVSKLRDCHFRELSELGMLKAPCPLQPPPCGGEWVQHKKPAVISASTWSQQVETKIYCCRCLHTAHTVHFCGEHLGLYSWTQGTILVQESLQLILKGMQRSGTAFSAELGRDQEAFAQSPESIVISDESWRRASLDFFKLVGREISECCTICGPFPEVSISCSAVSLESSPASLVGGRSKEARCLRRGPEANLNRRSSHRQKRSGLRKWIAMLPPPCCVISRRFETLEYSRAAFRAPASSDLRVNTLLLCQLVSLSSCSSYSGASG
jgi:hypothetical protein